VKEPEAHRSLELRQLAERDRQIARENFRRAVLLAAATCGFEVLRDRD
jgi:hypothetical protein